MFRPQTLRSCYGLMRTAFPNSKTAAVRMSSSAANVAPIESNGSKKRAFGQSYRFKNKKQKKEGKAVAEGSNEEVLLADVRALLAKHSLKDDASEPPKEDGASDSAQQALPEPFTEIDLTVAEISSTGDGLALSSDAKHVYIVPFTAPGDTVTAKVVKHFQQDSYSLADFVKVMKPSQHRDDSLIQCPYFASCSGCQFQMLPYDYQLAHKKTVVEKAYRNFSGLAPELVPEVGDTIGSPLQYGYRTKLTPHFDGPPGGRRDRRNGVRAAFKEVPPIGFMKKGTRHTIDIEDCPIGTDAVRMGMKSERKRVTEEIDKYQRGATLLLREDTKRIPKTSENSSSTAESTNGSTSPSTIYEDRGPYIHAKTCVTDPNATTTEYIDDFIFTNPAGAFFQNNNSILPAFTSYIRSHILPSTPSTPPITNLIDAYSGSGLFTITLSSLFKRSLGIDISPSSIRSATHNARLNKLPEAQASFIAADASNLFAEITFPADETVVVVDPPRKGCDETFLRQLLRFGPARVVYVSCNVHTQARDVGVLVGGVEGVDGGARVDGLYEIESLGGFDFFPQTGHVEGVAVLRKRGGRGKGEKGMEGEWREAEGSSSKTEDGTKEA